MARNVLQDMVPSNGGRSIRNIPLPKGRKEAPAPVKENSFPLRTKDNTFKISRFNKKPKKIWWWASGIAGVLIIALVIISFMSGARVEITPKIIKANISTILNGYKADSNSLSGVPENSLPFQVVTINKTGGKTVKANGEEQVKRKASGTIIIYNNTGSASQRLIKNTRFQSPEGLIFRVNDSVVVPGQKTVDGKKVPGSVEAVVYADDVGEKYNIGKTDFTIPGFKGDPRFETIYARSSTPMAGGFVGMVKKISDADRAAAEGEIEASLKLDLMKLAQSQIPNSMVILNGLEKYDFVPTDQTEPSGDSVKMNVKGQLTAVITDKQVLANFLAGQQSTLRNISVYIQNPESLMFVLKDGSKFDPTRDQTMQFSVKNEVTFVGQVKKDDLVAALIGKSKTDLQTIKDQFPAIQEMKVSLLPPWDGRLPTAAKDFTVVVNNPK